MDHTTGGARHIITVDDTLDGERLDRALHLLLPELSRSRLKALLAQGHISAGSHLCTDASKKVRTGQSFDIFVPDAVDAIPLGEDLPLSIVYEDEDLLVIDKQAGMTVHPAPGHYEHTLVNALIAHCGSSLSGIGGVRRPGIVHRLDKDTSGLMVAAKNDFAHAGLSSQLADRSLSRKYLALVWGHPSRKGQIDRPLGRSFSDRKKIAIVASGKAAITDYTLLRAVGPHASLVRCRLQTGRTHQIRVHMASIGHPWSATPAYGKRMTAGLRRESPALTSFPRQALHAAEIGFIHPRNGDKLAFESGLPADMADLIAAVSEPNHV